MLNVSWELLALHVIQFSSTTKAILNILQLWFLKNLKCDVDMHNFIFFWIPKLFEEWLSCFFLTMLRLMISWENFNEHGISCLERVQTFWGCQWRSGGILWPLGEYFRNIVRIFGAVRRMYGFFGVKVRTSWGYFRGRTVYRGRTVFFEGTLFSGDVLFKVIGQSWSHCEVTI